jgi:hypothetical protein
MPFDDSFAYRQTDTGTRIFLSGVEALENPEDRVEMLGLDSDFALPDFSELDKADLGHVGVDHAAVEGVEGRATQRATHRQLPVSLDDVQDRPALGVNPGGTEKRKQEKNPARSFVFTEARGAPLPLSVTGFLMLAQHKGTRHGAQWNVVTRRPEIYPQS